METHYIHLEAVRTSLQVIVTCKKLTNKDWMRWSRPAALSAIEPGRNLQGGWKTKACREAEEDLKPAKAKGILRRFLG